MLVKMAIRALITVCVVTVFMGTAVFAQGVARQDYSGLDKYPVEGRGDNFSFVGVRAAEFLTIPVGARGIGMGGAYSAMSDGISSLWWNPAGLGFITGKEVMFNVVDYTADLTYSFLAAASPIADGRLVIGGFIGYLDVPDIEITTVHRPEGTGSFYNAYDFQMGGTLAYTMSDRFIGGLTMKYVHQDVWGNLSGSAFAIDAGAIYHTELADREIRFSFTIQNLGTNITMRGPKLLAAMGPEDTNFDFPTGYENYQTDPEAMSRRNARQGYLKTNTYRLPTSVKLSLAYFLYTSEKTNWAVVGELQRPNYLPLSYATGTELTYSFDVVTSAALRMGWAIQLDEFDGTADEFGYEYLGNDDGVMRGFSFGGGIQRGWGSKSIQFDYAYKNKGRLASDNFFTIRVGF